MIDRVQPNGREHAGARVAFMQKATRMSVASLLTSAVPHVAVAGGELHPHPEAGSSTRRPARSGLGKRI